MSSANRPAAALSLDLDDLWSYLKTHGDPDWEDYPSFLDVAVPRALDFLAEFDLRITFFVVGRDASFAKNKELLSRIIPAGHEVGNHSFRHEPWLHRYGDGEVGKEIAAAERAIEEAVGVRPTGFRGPGYSLSPAVVSTLAARGYQYDASTLPSFIGPLARAYYFRSTDLTAAEKEERRALFGSASDVLMPMAPYRWRTADGSLLELPVTTMPLFRTPFHFSYLLYVASYSPRLANAYLRTALSLCRMRGIVPSLLFHPLDMLGPEDATSLKFFPGMDMDAGRKLELLHSYVTELTRSHDPVPLGTYAQTLNGARLRERAAVAR